MANREEAILSKVNQTDLDVGSVIASLAHVLQEQPAVPVNINAILASETNFLNLAAAGTHYVVRDVRLKVADPGANIVVVRLYGLVNNVLTQIDSYAIQGSLDPSGGNFNDYEDLMNMFGAPNLAGDQIKITVQVSPAGGPYAVTGEYSYGQAS